MENKYDINNPFYKILEGELTTHKIYEDEYILCFEDASKAADIHWLFITKKQYISYHDFTNNATPEEIQNFFCTINKVAQKYGLDKKGYKLVTNNGKNAGQSVFHFHVHLLSGDNLNHL